MKTHQGLLLALGIVLAALVFAGSANAMHDLDPVTGLPQLVPGLSDDEPFSGRYCGEYYQCMRDCHGSLTFCSGYCSQFCFIV